MEVRHTQLYILLYSTFHATVSMSAQLYRITIVLYTVLLKFVSVIVKLCHAAKVHIVIKKIGLLPRSSGDFYLTTTTTKP